MSIIISKAQLLKIDALPEKQRAVIVQKMSDSGINPVAIPILANQQQRAPLSFNQQRLWFLSQYEQCSAAYNLYQQFNISGKLDTDRLQQALNQVTHFHTILRTRICIDNGQPKQVVDHKMAFNLKVIDVQGQSASDINRKVEQLTKVEFELEQAPLFKVTCLTIGEHPLCVVFVAHHLLLDGWSLNLLCEALQQAYSAPQKKQQQEQYKNGDLAIQYSDYALWQRNWLTDALLSDQLDYWQQKLQHRPVTSTFPTVHPRPAQVGYVGDVYRLEFGNDFLTALNQQSAQHGVTPYMVLLTCFKLVLSRYANQKQVIVGTPIAGRMQPELASVLGYFANTVAIKSDFSAALSLLDAVNITATSVKEALEYQLLPFEMLLSSLDITRDLAHSPLFQTLFIYHNVDQAPSFSLGDSLWTPQAVHNKTAKYDMTTEVLVQEQSVTINFEYNVGLYDQASVEAIANTFCRFVETFLASADEKLERLGLLSRAEQQLYHQRLNPAGKETGKAPQPSDYMSIFHRAVEDWPQHIALAGADTSISYLELRQRVLNMAIILHREGVKSGHRVGVLLSDKIELVVSILALWQIGAVYVPLAPDSPVTRLNNTVAKARLFLLLVDVHTRSLVANETVTISDIGRLTEPDVTRQQVIDASEFTPVRGQHPAYIIFTSGSTGEPKGVVVAHQSFANFIHVMKATLAITAEDCLLSVTTPTFDISLLEYFLPLAVGAKCHLAPYATKSDGFALKSLVEHVQPTVMQATPSLYQMLYAALWQGQPGLKVLCGGEALPLSLSQQLLADCDQLWNLYGPTETTIWSLCQQIKSTDKRVSIGRSMANTHVYVLDAFGQEVPAGVAGELCIGGLGVASGYFDNPSLTERYFVKDIGQQEGIMYRTGDLVSYDRQGLLYFIGRSDQQVKIRGYRVELGDIESSLATLDPVAAVAVKVTECQPQGLVAFIEPKDKTAFTLDAVKVAAGALLPGYMLPNAWVIVDTLPKSTSGKIDRKQLHLPEVVVEVSQVIVDPLELELQLIWQAVLNAPVMGRDSNFFALGGHSVLAVELVSKIEQELHYKVPLKVLFAGPTIAGLGQYLSTLTPGISQTCENSTQLAADGSHRYDKFPLTDVQRAYWLGREMQQTATHIYQEIDLIDLDSTVFATAFNQLIKRHDMLRAIVHLDGTQQVLRETPQYPIVLETIAPLDLQQQLTLLDDIRNEMSHKVHPLAQWPMFEVRISRLDENVSRVHFGLDLLIADAPSLQIMLDELAHYYSNPEVELPALPFSFRDHVLGEQQSVNGSAFAEAKQYWQGQVKQFGGRPQLPIKQELSALTSVKFVRRSHQIPAGQWSNLIKASQQLSLSKTGLLLSVFSHVLSRYSQKQHFSLNLTVFNRPGGVTGAARLVGDYTSISILDVDCTIGQSLAQLASSIGQRLWSDLDHRAFSGIRVAELLIREGIISDALPVVFTSLVDMDDSGSSHFSKVFEQSADYGLVGAADVTQTPQVWLDHQVMECDGVLHFNWDVVEQLFDRDTVDAMFNTYCDLLSQLANDTSLWVSPCPLTLPPVAATVQRSVISDTLLHSGLQAQARQNPDHMAVIDSQMTLSYRQLDNAANQCGWTLLQSGVSKGDLVAVIMDKGWAQVAAVHGILRIGAAYIPIDPEWPQQRREALLTLTGAKVVTTIPESWCELETPRLSGVDIGPTDLAYVIFTSGSTGQPKGVMIDHQGAMNTIIDINRRFDLSAGDRIFGLSALSFDLSVFDIFAPYFVGAGLVLPAKEGLKDPRHWGQLLRQHKVTVWNTVPALLLMLSEFEYQSQTAYPLLRLALLSGDWIPLNLPEDARVRLNDKLSVISLGGATECSIWSVFYPIEQLDPQWTSIPYGRGLTNQPLYVLNQRMEECPPGISGEIYIGGPGLAIGYYQDLQKTAERFIHHPQSGERLYRTGDLGRYFADGIIEFIGRVDNQVKVNGFRVELGEIKFHLEQIPAIKAAEVIVNKNQLFALVQTGEMQKSVFIDALKQVLPNYMIPNDLIAVESFAITSNGKIDRQQLSQKVSEYMQHKQSAIIRPANQFESTIQAIWRSVLVKDNISIDDNFYDIGGTSIEAVLVHRQLEKKLGVSIAIVDLFRYHTIKKLAVYLANSEQSTHIQADSAMKDTVARASRRNNTRRVRA